MTRNEMIKARLDAAKAQATKEKNCLDLTKGGIKCTYATGTGVPRKAETIPFDSLQRAANYKVRGSGSGMTIEDAEALFMRGQSLSGGRRAGTRKKPE
jgi:hypothetical protein